MPHAASASIGPLASCRTFGCFGSASQVASAAWSAASRSSASMYAAVPSVVASATPVTSPEPAPHRPTTCTPTRSPAVACSASQPASWPAPRTVRRHVEAALLDLLLGAAGSRRAGHAAPGTPGRRTACAPRAGPTAAARGRSEPGPAARSRTRRVELAVADHVAEVLAQRLALLARDLVGVGDDVVEPVVLVDPLRGVALAHAGDAGQVVGVLPDQCRDLGVARRRHAVLVLHRRRGHPGQVGHAAHRVEHRRPVGDQLEGVAVTGEDQHLHLVVLRAPGWTSVAMMSSAS